MIWETKMTMGHYAVPISGKIALPGMKPPMKADLLHEEVAHVVEDLDISAFLRKMAIGGLQAYLRMEYGQLISG